MPSHTKNTPPHKDQNTVPTGAKITLNLLKAIEEYEQEQNRLWDDPLPPSQKICVRTKGKAHSRTKTKGWSEERRQKQRQRIKQNKPWLKSTGPRSKTGKENAKMNGLKHGLRSRAMKNLYAALRAQKHFVRAVMGQEKLR